MILTPTDIAILTALARFRFLNADQMSRVIPGNRDYLQRRARYLSLSPKKSPLVRVSHFPVHARFGKLAHQYSLSPAGVAHAHRLGIADEESGACLPLFSEDYFHRTAVIDYHISLEQALVNTEWSLARNDQYFVRASGNQRGKSEKVGTYIPFPDGTFFIPDSIFRLAQKDSPEALLLVLEYVRGRNRKRTLAQIGSHQKALRLGCLPSAFRISPDQGYVAVFVCEDAALLAWVRRHLMTQDSFRPFREYFLFAEEKHTRHDVLGCYRQIGELRSLVSCLTGNPTYPLPESSRFP